MSRVCSISANKVERLTWTVSKKMRRAPKQLRSLAILDERSAVPSLTVKSTTAPKTPKPISKSEKTRLRRIARKELVDPDADAPTSNLAVGSITPQSDAWEKEKVTVKKGTFGEETMVVRKVKAPKTVAEQRAMRRARLGLQMELPDDGTSYNPRAESHAALMERAIAEEMELLRREKDTEERMKELAEVVNSRKAVGRTGEFADGMLVDQLDGDDGESGSELDPADIPLPKKQTVRKTQAQRNKALKKRAAAEAEERERKQRAIHKQLGASAVYEIEKAGKERLEEMNKKDQATKAARKEKERLGLEGGEKIGKWNVPKGRVEVQLGEDLAESLRQLKVSHSEPSSGASATSGAGVASVYRARASERVKGEAQTRERDVHEDDWLVFPSPVLKLSHTSLPATLPRNLRRDHELTISPREINSKIDSLPYKRKLSSNQGCLNCMSISCSKCE